MDSVSNTLLIQIGLAVVVTVLGFIAGRTRDTKQHENETLARLTKEMEQLKATSVSEVRVREIIKDVIDSTSSDVKEIKATINELVKTLQDIQIKLAAEMAYKRGKQEGGTD